MLHRFVRNDIDLCLFPCCWCRNRNIIFLLKCTESTKKNIFTCWKYLQFWYFQVLWYIYILHTKKMGRSSALAWLLLFCSVSLFTQKIFSGDMGNENFSAIVSTLYLYYNCHLPRLSYIQTSMRLEKFKYPWKKQLLNSRISEKRCNLEWCSRGYVLISQM